MTKHAVIVDGYHLVDGDDRGFASAFRTRGVEPVTVLSTPEPTRKFLAKWHPDDFAAVHYYDGDFDGLVATVESYDPLCIVAGQEPGVELAAALVERLMPTQGNEPGSAVLHRDKGEMAPALEAAGVPALRTIGTDDPGEVQAWIDRHGLAGKRLVVKPPKAGGTDHVYLAGAGTDWRPFFEELLGSLNCYGQRNDTVVVQEYAPGTEYMIDLYSADGRHGVVDVCVYAKHDRGNRIAVYEYAQFLPPDHPDLQVVAPYAKRCADALGIRNGSSHVEVMVTPDGPRLIELGARYAGSCVPLAAKLATGDTQVRRTVRHHVDGTFTPSYELRQQARVTWLAAEASCTARDAEVLEAVVELPTVKRFSVPREGDRVAETFDTATFLGWVVQIAPDQDAIDDDYVRIRALERDWNARQLGHASTR